MDGRAPGPQPEAIGVSILTAEEAIEIATKFLDVRLRKSVQLAAVFERDDYFSVSFRPPPEKGQINEWFRVTVDKATREPTLHPSR